MLAWGAYTVPAQAKQAHVRKGKKKNCNEVMPLNEAGFNGLLSNSAVFSLQVRSGGTYNM